MRMEMVPDMTVLPYLAFLYVAILVGVAAVYDFRFMIIPNWISISLAAGFIVLAAVKGFTLDQWLWHGGVALGMFVAGILLFVLRAMGGGDVKLLAATSLFIGMEPLLPYLFLVTALGAVIAIAKMIALAISTWRAGKKLERKVLMKSEIPYGIAIALGTVIVFPFTIWMV